MPDFEDKVFAEDMKINDFQFDKTVVDVFDDMVARSVPLYRETQTSALNLAKNFVAPKTNVYDIGSSTGTLLIHFADLVNDQTVEFVGYDCSKPMIDKAIEKLDASNATDQLKFRLGNIEEDLSLNNASVIFMTYTLQFIRPLRRQIVINKLFEALNPGGALIMIEKVLGNNSLFNRLYIDLYYDYKAQVGYSDKEIVQKREALENILIPYRMDENVTMLSEAGFESIDTFFKWYNWAGIIAVKQ